MVKGETIMTLDDVLTIIEIVIGVFLVYAVACYLIVKFKGKDDDP